MRIIATILFIEDKVVQSYGFSSYRIIGDPTIVVKHLDSWQVDEITVLQIDNSFSHLLSNLQLINSVSTTPITVGGGLSSLEMVKSVIESGADRVCIQSLVFANINEVKTIADHFGGQSITLKFDFCKSFLASTSFWSLRFNNIDLVTSILSDLKSYDVDDIFFYNTSADGLVQVPNFTDFLLNYNLSDYSIILGGGLNPEIANQVFCQCRQYCKELSLSFSNYFYQKELANKLILRGIPSLPAHRLS